MFTGHENAHSLILPCFVEMYSTVKNVGEKSLRVKFSKLVLLQPVSSLQPHLSMLLLTNRLGSTK